MVRLCIEADFGRENVKPFFVSRILLIPVASTNSRPPVRGPTFSTLKKPFWSSLVSYYKRATKFAGRIYLATLCSPCSAVCINSYLQDERKVKHRNPAVRGIFAHENLFFDVYVRHCWRHLFFCQIPSNLDQNRWPAPTTKRSSHYKAEKVEQQRSQNRSQNRFDNTKI